MNKQRYTLFILLFFLITVMSGCSSNTPINQYAGRDLEMGVIGDYPDIMESNKVAISSIDFEDLTNDRYKNYDAVFMEDRLVKGKRQGLL